MIRKILFFCLLIGIIGTQNAVASSEASKSELKESVEPAVAALDTGTAKETAVKAESIDETNKGKRQIDSKDTQNYPNHRAETLLDDPEVAQETIYGPKPNQFIIRAVSPHQHQQHEDHQDPQLRNYPKTVSPSTAQRSQQLDQSQEIQHFAYLQELSRNHPKISASGGQGKSRAGLSKKNTATRAQLQYSKPEEAEQRYAVAIQTPQYNLEVSQHHQLQHQQQHQHQPPPQHQQQQQQQQPPHPYQIIPEEQFLKLIEQELQARAYHDERLRQQQAFNKLAPFNDRPIKGPSNYRQRLLPQPLPPTPVVTTPTPSVEVDSNAPLAPTAAYVQYVPRHRGGPKYLPFSQQQNQHQHHQHFAEQQRAELQDVAPELPPQIAYYQPQISYKTLPNHPLAKSSLEKEIEKLLANNQPSAAAVQIIDNSNEPSGVVNHHYESQSQAPSNRSPKSYISNTTPNSLLDANNQPFIPSLFRFSNYQTPTPIYPTQVPPQHVIEAKKLGPVVYPTQTSTTAQPALPSQYYYQEAAPNTKPKAYRNKQYDLKLLQPTQLKQQREKSVKIHSEPKYAQTLVYDFNSNNNNNNPASQTQTQPQHSSQQFQSEFYPSPPDPNNPDRRTQPTQSTHSMRAEKQPSDFRQFMLPAAAPSQSSIYVSQGTGVTTPSRPAHVAHGHNPKTIEDVKQLHLPQPGGKPLTQAEFQALLDAGYPVTAVPVPVPVPYEQYFKDHPEYRNQPLDYAQIMRNVQQQYAASSQSLSASVPHGPSVKIISSPSEPESATVSAVGGGSVTYLRPIQSSPATNQRRHPRNNDKETDVTMGDANSNPKTNTNAQPDDKKDEASN